MHASDPALLFPNPPLDSLNSTLSHLALRRGLALKFPREVTPFSALLENTTAAVTDLHSLLEPSESTYVISTEPPSSIPSISVAGPYPVRQFDWPADAPLPSIADNFPVEPLTCAHAAEMVELTSIAFPGFFRIRTCEMGLYFGIRDNGRLVAMCGERLNIRDSREGDFHEISGLCTLPEFRRRGYAPALVAHLLHRHHDAGLRSYLHVASDNATAIALYQRLGFRPRGEFPLYSIRHLA
jgi:ribosomal protein S18 acetylase RimI-like enzyme